jgi:hypothetical protein
MVAVALTCKNRRRETGKEDASAGMDSPSVST